METVQNKLIIVFFMDFNAPRKEFHVFINLRESLMLVIMRKCLFLSIVFTSYNNRNAKELDDHAHFGIVIYESVDLL